MKRILLIALCAVSTIKSMQESELVIEPELVEVRLVIDNQKIKIPEKLIAKMKLAAALASEKLTKDIDYHELQLEPFFAKFKIETKDRKAFVERFLQLVGFSTLKSLLDDLTKHPVSSSELIGFVQFATWIGADEFANMLIENFALLCIRTPGCVDLLLRNVKGDIFQLGPQVQKHFQNLLRNKIIKREQQIVTHLEQPVFDLKWSSDGLELAIDMTLSTHVFRKKVIGWELIQKNKDKIEGPRGMWTTPATVKFFYERKQFGFLQKGVWKPFEAHQIFIALNGNLLTTYDFSKTIIWQRKGDYWEELQIMSPYLIVIGLDPQGEYIAVKDEVLDVVGLWQFQKSKFKRIQDLGKDGSFPDVKWNPQGTIFVENPDRSSEINVQLRFWYKDTDGTWSSHFEMMHTPNIRFSWSPDGTMLAIIGRDKDLEIYQEQKTGFKKIGTLPIMGDIIDWNPDNITIVAGSSMTQVQDIKIVKFFGNQLDNLSVNQLLLLQISERQAGRDLLVNNKRLLNAMLTLPDNIATMIQQNLALAQQAAPPESVSKAAASELKDIVARKKE